VLARRAGEHDRCQRTGRRCGLWAPGFSGLRLKGFRFGPEA